MQFELGNAAKITLKLLEDAIAVFSEVTGHEPIVRPQNKGGECKLVTRSREFADYFHDLLLG